MKKIQKSNLLHIILIIIGAVLILIPAFHSDIWFDESYSVSIVEHSFAEIWKIGGNDVHPILYYWMLKVINIIFGSNIIIYRIFSAIGIIALSILGITHIKKDFGKETGFLFSFFSLFLPTMLSYALEIRMYSWTAFFVSLMAIYLYRFIKEKNIKNTILFGIFSIISCYMHYYALVCAGLMNLFLIIYIIKERKNIDKNIIKTFVIVEIAQVILYIPWLFYFIGQLTRVGGGFWITIEFPHIIISLLNFQFKASMQETIPTIIAIALWIYLIYIIVKNIKNKEDIKPGIGAMIFYLAVIVVAAIASIISPILYERYLFTITGLLIFAISYFLSKENKKYVNIVICIVILVMSLINVYKTTKENYDSSNIAPIKYLQENLKKDDILIYKDIGNGGVVATFFKDNQQYFLNLDHWTIEEAYKAYAPQMGIAYSIDEAISKATGRIILVDTSDLSLYNKFENKDEFDEIEIKEFNTKYRNYTYKFVTLQKRTT